MLICEFIQVEETHNHLLVLYTHSFCNLLWQPLFVCMFERVHSYDFNTPMDLWAALSTHLCMHINLRRYNCTWIVTSIKTCYGDVQDTLKTWLQTTASEWFVCTSPISPSCLQVKVGLYMASDVLDTKFCTRSYRGRTFDSSFIFNSVLQISVHCIESGREGCENISLCYCI